MSASAPLGLTVTPSVPVIGAEVSGLDLGAPMTQELRDELHRLLSCHRVLFFRDQHLSTLQQIAFAEAFGPIFVFRGVLPLDPQHREVHDLDGSTVDWHLDASGTIEPPVATVLRAVEIPPAGGDTIWANGIAAYNGLPAGLKKQLESLCATHTPPTAHPAVAHPLVSIHPDTGERYLYINLAPWVDTKILGLSVADSEAVVRELKDHYLRPEYQVRFRWSPGALAMWDNRVTQHTGIRDYGDNVRRRMKRLSIARFHQD